MTLQSTLTQALTQIGNDIHDLRNSSVPFYMEDPTPLPTGLWVREAVIADIAEGDYDFLIGYGLEDEEESSIRYFLSIDGGAQGVLRVEFQAGLF